MGSPIHWIKACTVEANAIHLSSLDAEADLNDAPEFDSPGLQKFCDLQPKQLLDLAFAWEIQIPEASSPASLH